MLRLHPVSDIHGDIKHNDWDNPDVDADVIVCAGDAMAPATLAIPYIRRLWPKHRIVYTMGNHDFYSDHRHAETKTTWEFQRDNAPLVAVEHDVILLDGGYSNGVVEIDGTRFVGGTVWTDQMSYPKGRYIHGEIQRMSRAMNDYRQIKTGAGRSRDVFEVKDSIADHRRAIKFVIEELGRPFDGDTVLLTHHALSEKSLFAGVAVKDLDWCYASNCEYLFHPYDAETNPNVTPTHAPPVLHIHGHIHSNRDYVVGETRVIANPRGYPAGHPMTWRANGPRENPDFDPGLIVEVGRDLTPQFGM